MTHLYKSVEICRDSYHEAMKMVMMKEVMVNKLMVKEKVTVTVTVKERVTVET